MKLEKFKDYIVEAVNRGHESLRRSMSQIADAVIALDDRVKRIESVPPPAKGEKGEPGRDGKDADPINIRDVIAELAIAPEVKTVMALMVAEAVQEGVAKALPDAVSAYIKANPPPAGRDGVDGKDGEKGRDGLDVRDMLRNADNHLIAVMSDGTTRDLGVCVGKDGKDGHDGVDGKSYEGHSVTYDAVTHEGVIRTLSGLETRFPLPGIVYRGYWKEGVRAKANEAWTHDGMLWIASKDTDARPDVANKGDWSIGARKGAVVRERTVSTAGQPVKLLPSED